VENPTKRSMPNTGMRRWRDSQSTHSPGHAASTTSAAERRGQHESPGARVATLARRHRKPSSRYDNRRRACSMARRGDLTPTSAAENSGCSVVDSIR